jgi:hypothetical protein
MVQLPLLRLFPEARAVKSFLENTVGAFSGIYKLLPLFPFLIFGVFSLEVKASTFQATLSCEFSGKVMTTAACLINDGSMSYIEITTFEKPDIIQPYELNRLGQETRDGVKFTLSKSFNFRVVNASDHLTLRLIIADRNGNLVYEDAVGRLGVLYVGN